MPFDGFEIEIEGLDGAAVFPSLCAGGCRLWIRGRLRRWSRKRKPPTVLAPGGHYGAVALLLTDARGLIEGRNHWIQGAYRWFRGQRCAVGALCAAAKRIGDVRVLQSAHALLLTVADSRRFYTVESMNDHSTHADVVRAFDEAIALVSLTVALTAVAWFAPTDLVQLVLGTLLLLFGLRLLREAVLRAGGATDGQQRDTASIRAVVRLRWNSRNGTANSAGILVASVVTLLTPNIVAISFVVMALATAGRGIVPPVVGALIALLLVVPLGLAFRRRLTQLARVVLGFVAGAWLAGFGAFWSAKGIGVSWLGEDAAVLVLTGAFIGMGLLLVPLVRSRVSGVA